jgi:hypothetical protein
MAPDQRGEVGDVVVVDVHAVRADLANGLLYVDGVPMHDGIESEAKGAELLFLSLQERTPDFAAFAVMNAPRRWRSSVWLSWVRMRRRNAASST